jgi:hypothetical protein
MPKPEASPIIFDNTVLSNFALVSCHTFKLGMGSEQDAKPAAWLRLTHYKGFAVFDIKV